MLFASVAVVFGLGLLVFSADRFVMGASGLAYNLGISPLMIGLTIVAFGTSAPEIFVSATAALQDNPNLAIGNAIGSNIANVGLVLSSAAIIAPIIVQREVLGREIFTMFLVMMASLVVFFNNYLSRLEGILLIVGLALFIVYTIVTEKKRTPLIDENTIQISAPKPLLSVTWLISGLILLVLSSKILVWGAVKIAQSLGVSDLIIGLTIVAIGTSLPEVATSITSALRNKPELVIGNIVGSNIFNILAVVGIAGVISPTTLNTDIMSRDIPVMFTITFLALIFITPWRKKHLLSRTGGSILLVSYIIYLIYLISQTIGG